MYKSLQIFFNISITLAEDRDKQFNRLPLPILHEGPMLEASTMLYGQKRITVNTNPMLSVIREKTGAKLGFNVHIMTYQRPGLFRWLNLG